MKRLTGWLALPLSALVVLGSAGCSVHQQTGEAAVSASAQTTSATPAVSLFHTSKKDSTSLAENVLWEYFDHVNSHDLDAVFAVLGDDLKGAYADQDRIVFRNFKSAQVVKMYDLTDQMPPTKYVEARYFYVEVKYELNHLYESNDTDGVNYRLALVARESQNSPYHLIDLSHCPQMQEVPADTKDDPNTSINMPQNPSTIVNH
ncbi:MAG: hypothetical protein ACXVP5_04540 [Tumebacillaceae bacterium]